MASSAYAIDYLTPEPTSPLGTLRILASQHGVREIAFVESAEMPAAPSPLTDTCREQLNAYFKGELRDFDVPLDPQGTPFQQRVWAALSRIPFGETRSYAEIARDIDNLKAMRAVGAANGRNPLPIVVPCHRVIGRDGTLTGYAGGIERKAWLLELERTHIKHHPMR
ncbi:methylated-DNA--[protein]-cysteine S-methyltransferase [Chromohalobacter canadensis]|uniref:methylated-DNA--[protein]-cysteine S-methyltransferase n=1 Tax=Chromohalobacter canadensis TaxID=141389 RepID=UPI0021BF7CCB|nr:methylated-DNA--[protein]-cysteine S-methyltransferase [Chromohalobacter canadensis]MCT8468461.1 methylated-DNA--[protein]-cysteine S-methyltransferase [Chromohalobacter canadensis]MCT8471516.1 methylated-DNA--[protein]-cysteine S-methyltransferase [Chromohalobacter canadensis]MCT8498969.1 methylated-DNA--[protein]-cysteine S-methyltransferase [Chromohalobacter canadensis]